MDVANLIRTVVFYGTGAIKLFYIIFKTKILNLKRSRD